MRFGVKPLRFLGVAAMAIVLPGVARAHHFMDGQLPRTLTQGWLSGLAHPIIGVDHLAFVVAMGFLLATVKGGLWGVASFTSGTLVGAILHLAGLGMPWVEGAVALSVVGIAGLMMVRSRVRLFWLIPDWRSPACCMDIRTRRRFSAPNPRLSLPTSRASAWSNWRSQRLRSASTIACAHPLEGTCDRFRLR